MTGASFTAIVTSTAGERFTRETPNAVASSCSGSMIGNGAVTRQIEARHDGEGAGHRRDAPGALARRRGERLTSLWRFGFCRGFTRSTGSTRS